MIECARCGRKEVKEKNGLCKECQIADNKNKEQEERRVKEVNEMQKMIREGLCEYCSKIKKCELVNNPQIGRCRPNDRCSDFIQK